MIPPENLKEEIQNSKTKFGKESAKVSKMVLTPYTESDQSEGTAEALDFKRNYRILQNSINIQRINKCSAYAHNSKMLVKSGDNVTAGQKIAEMGSSGATRVMLEFQVRLDGKPVNPTTVLPN